MIAAIAMVRDEADVIGETVGHMLQQVDRVYVADNQSSDGTRDLLDSFGLTVLDDPVVAYRQSEKMSALAERARQDGAEWVVPFDADEVWLARTGQRLADVLNEVDPGIHIVEAQLFDYVATARDDLSLPPVERMQWHRREPLPLPKVAFRAYEGAVIHQGNHGVTLPDVSIPLSLGGLLQVSHFPYRSAEQMIRKVRNGAEAYNADPKIPQDLGAHWRQWGEFSDREIADLFLKWYFRTKPEKPIKIDGEFQPPLVHEPVPLWAAQPA